MLSSHSPNRRALFLRVELGRRLAQRAHAPMAAAAAPSPRSPLIQRREISGTPDSRNDTHDSGTLRDSVLARFRSFLASILSVLCGLKIDRSDTPSLFSAVGLFVSPQQPGQGTPGTRGTNGSVRVCCGPGSVVLVFAKMVGGLKKGWAKAGA